MSTTAATSASRSHLPADLHHTKLCPQPDQFTQCRPGDIRGAACKLSPCSAGAKSSNRIKTPDLIGISRSTAAINCYSMLQLLIEAQLSESSAKRHPFGGCFHRQTDIYRSQQANRPVGKGEGITHTLTNLSGTHLSRIKASDSAGETCSAKQALNQSTLIVSSLGISVTVIPPIKLSEPIHLLWCHQCRQPHQIRWRNGQPSRCAATAA